MSGKVISFLERKKHRAAPPVEHSPVEFIEVEGIHDLYIPYKEISFWHNISEYGKGKSWFLTKDTDTEAKEFFSTFSTDLEMYKDFGETLDKFRFFFSYFELYVLHKVMNQYKEHNVFNKESDYYLDYLSTELSRNKEQLNALNAK